MAFYGFHEEGFCIADIVDSIRHGVLQTSFYSSACGLAGAHGDIARDGLDGARVRSRGYGVLVIVRYYANF
jgi:hypothetical protein